MGQARGYVSPIPADYVARTLRRLLPPPEVIRTMQSGELRRLEAKRQELTEMIEHEPIRFFKPHRTGGQREFLTNDDPAILVHIFCAGNKGGKTTAAVIRHLERRAGCALWSPHSRKLHLRTPSRGVFFAEDFESHGEVIVPALRAWAPPGFIRQINRNPAGHVTSIEYANGSITYMRTYDQGTAKAEGKDWDDLTFDEPPPRDIWVAARRGLVSTGGLCFVAATLVKESWLFDENEFDFVRLYEGDMDDNEYLSDFHRNAYLDSLTDDERLVRKSGRPSSLTGLIYKTFRDGEPFIVPVPDKLPADCPIVMVVDPHERKPVHVLWGWVDGFDRITWFDWLLTGGAFRGSLSEIFSDIEEQIATHPQRPVMNIMDPKRGMAKQLGGSCWKDEFEEHGFDVTLGDYNHHEGITKVREYLRPDSPGMFFTERCRGKGGPIWQMQRAAWDDEKIRRERDPKEIAKARYMDFPDCIRYAAMADLRYSDLVSGPVILSRLPAGWKQQRLHAYC